LERNVRFTVNRDGRSIPISARWNRDARQAGRDAPVAVSPGRSIQIDPVKGIEWRIDLQRADGTTFPAGRYAVEVALGDARDYVSAAGQPWLGATPRSAPVTVLVAPPATARERAAAFRLAGTIALRGNRQAEAVQAFHRARAADPADHLSMIDLGIAHLRVNRHTEAIVEFENALRLMPRRDRSAVPSLLAFAHVALGDESNAARVLRELACLNRRSVRSRSVSGDSSRPKVG
jgi:predicted Zn-dependent protease